MEIIGTIKKVQYKVKLANQLNTVDWADFDINKIPTSCLISNGKTSFAISKWVSPKRTRSYPYERVYNTLNIAKKITVIPIVKDEGANGDRDFIQWDTISLMSLLDVYVIPAYYCKAKKRGEKITNQAFDNAYILSKIKEIETFHSSALHWNLNELNENFDTLLEKVKNHYSQIEQDTGVKLHNLNGIDNFKEKISKEVSAFMVFSREKAKNAQNREMQTIQPKEALSTLTKAKITITNYLGGHYFLTVDEIDIKDNCVSLIEGKHTKNALLPSKSDIKDGLLKMILYCNLSKVRIEANAYTHKPILELTSIKIIGKINSNDNEDALMRFFEANSFNKQQKNLVNTLFEEAHINNFVVSIKHTS